MTLETHLCDILEYTLPEHSNHTIATDQLIQSIDLTLLDEDASDEALTTVYQQAIANNVAAICVLTKHLHYFNVMNSINLATVINFPNGMDALQTSLDHINEAASLNATEIDYVLPYKDYLSGDKKAVLDECAHIAQSCKKHRLSLKIILETGAFPDMQTIYEVSRELITLGCDFLKTSTGKTTPGATLSAAFAMLSAIKDSNSPCGIKLSGGVKTPQHAYRYAYLAELILGKKIDKQWFRIGASSLLSELLDN